MPEICRTAGKDQSVNKSDDVIRCDRAIGKQLIDIGVDSDNLIKCTGNCVGIELGKNCFQGSFPTQEPKKYRARDHTLQEINRKLMKRSKASMDRAKLLR